MAFSSFASYRKHHAMIDPLPTGLYNEIIAPNSSFTSYLETIYYSRRERLLAGLDGLKPAP
jgi:hypothetical protein